MDANRLSPPITCRENKEQPPYQHHVDTADDISVAIEVKFLLPVLPLDTHDSYRTDGRGVLRVSSPGDAVTMQHQGYAAVADTINQVPGQWATTTHQIADSAGPLDTSGERDFWTRTGSSSAPIRPNPCRD